MWPLQARASVPARLGGFRSADAGIVRELPAYRRWEMRPELDIRWNGTVFRTNRHGYRGPEVELQKPAGTYRVVVFGSSNTMGYGVDNDDVYTRHLENWLNGYLGQNGIAVEVVNLAVAGDSPSRKLARIQHEAAALGRGLDPLRCVRSRRLARGSPHSLGSSESGRNSVLVRSEAASPRESPRPTRSTPFATKFQGESERMLPDIYAAYGVEARRLGLPLTIVILPRADDKAKSPRVVRLIRSLASQNGLDYLDLSDAFDELEVDEFRISDWDKHPNARGHLAIFEAMRNALLERGGPPGLPFLTLQSTTASR